jgi:hypothetical protein
MPPRKKSIQRPKQKQGPPIAFRPGAELAQLVATFAGSRGVGEHEAYKHLAALAVMGLDMRHYDLVAALAATQPGVNPFVRAVLRLSTALMAVLNVDGRYAHDPYRTRFLAATVHQELGGTGGLPAELMRSLLAAVEPAPGDGGQTAGEEPEFQTTARGSGGETQKERVPVRLT